MAKKDKSNNAQHDADDATRSAAIAKMKAAQSEAATDNLDQKALDEAGSGDDRHVTEAEIDPKAKKALVDLLGKAGEEKGVIKQVKVYSPFRVYYDSTASSVSAVNGTGPFDVLPGHRNFLSLLAASDIVVRSASGKEERITIERGIMHVHGDVVQVFLDV
jgi:hypothetical protein